MIAGKPNPNSETRLPICTVSENLEAEEKKREREKCGPSGMAQTLRKPVIAHLQNKTKKEPRQHCRSCWLLFFSTEMGNMPQISAYSHTYMYTHTRIHVLRPPGRAYIHIHTQRTLT